MYLKKIKAHGFKSFADNIDIEPSTGITGIVGPNGSGKSNVVDAIRWVLGEQSVKSLRGDDKMSDVIFSGSKSRAPMNVASVTLVFDNKDHYLPLDYDEVELKRRVYRDGTNEYYLNNKKVRLKDISNLLLDGGIAKESFNIISQGKIESIINSKANDRRGIIEEAAGVLKYKRRKEEAIKKLEKTKNNVDRVNDIISELENQINPLKEAKEKAITYKKCKKDLESIEIALITEEITNINYEYQKEKEKIELLNKELLALNTNSSKNEAEAEKFKIKITNIDEEIRKVQNDLLSLTAEAERLNGQKNMIVERQKYQTKDSKVHDHLLALKEKEGQLKTEINNLEQDVINLNNNINNLKTKEDKLTIDLNMLKTNKNKLEFALTGLIRKQNTLKINRDNLISSIDNHSTLPAAVKAVLNNPKLRGIHDALGNLMETKEEYALAISVALGFASNYIVTDREDNAKEAINYIKNIGRATFLPLNVIKPKYLEPNIFENLKKLGGFIKTAKSLIKNDPKYDNVFSNLLGNIIVTDTLDRANKIAKTLNYKYRIVTLSGEVVNVGGSLTGGKINNNRNIISEKYELEKILKDFNFIIEDIKNKENEINENDYNLKGIEDKLYLITKEKMLKVDEINNKKEKIKNLNSELEQVNVDIRGTTNILNGVLSVEEEEIINKYYEVVQKRDEKDKQITELLKEKEETTLASNEYELSIKEDNKLLTSKSNELKDLEVSTNRMDVKLDNLLNILSEDYSITYEKAKENYKLDIPYNLAKNKVNSLKRQIKDLGEVNLTAEAEYEKVFERYEFLNKQITDLLNAENTLNTIINEMDKVMIKEFEIAFKTINKLFGETFKELFKGGKAMLKLTEPNNLLETGVEIIASPPGKKVGSITLLSGGEKTLTAISLLFAIIKAHPAPFCVLDEVEAALDEANVDTFGKYVQSLKQLSQFIIITHKKVTMEYADILYGITMQESGVSKLVSVSLEEIGA